MARLVLPFAVAIGAAGVGAFTGGVLPVSSGAVSATGDEVFACRVTDGDTIRCGDERIRLLAIDAPELPSHCRTGRECAPGDPYASGTSLGAAMAALSASNGLALTGMDARWARSLATAATCPAGNSNIIRQSTSLAGTIR